MDLSKLALTSPPASVSLDYSEEVGEVIFTVNTSFEGWGGMLMQLGKRKKHPLRY